MVSLAGSRLVFVARPELDLSVVAIELPRQGSTETPDADLSVQADTSTAADISSAGEAYATIRFKPGIPLPIGAADDEVRCILPQNGSDPQQYYRWWGHIVQIGRIRARSDGRCDIAIAIKCNSQVEYIVGDTPADPTGTVGMRLQPVRMVYPWDAQTAGPDPPTAGDPVAWLLTEFSAGIETGIVRRDAVRSVYPWTVA